MIRANKSPNLRKVSRVAGRMQLVSHGASVGLWNLRLKVPRATVSHAHDRLSRVPRGTATSPRKRSRPVSTWNIGAGLLRFSQEPQVFAGRDVPRGTLHPATPLLRFAAKVPTPDCSTWNLPASRIQPMANYKGRPFHDQNCLECAAKDVPRGTYLARFHTQIYLRAILAQ